MSIPACIYVYLINFTTNVLLIDNAAIHHVHEVEDYFARTGVLLRYLPAYSPDLNPIEQAFASTKRFVRDNENVYLSTREPTPIIIELFAQISRELCQSYFHHCGYL